MSLDRRRSFRYPVLGERQKVLLRLPGRNVDARLVDESSGGFGLQIPDSVPIAAGQIALLRTLSGWSQVRVVRIARDEPYVRLGVERLRDLAMLDDEPPPRGGMLRRCLERFSPKRRPGALAGLLLALALVLPMAIRYGAAKWQEEPRSAAAQVKALRNELGHASAPHVSARDAKIAQAETATTLGQGSHPQRAGSRTAARSEGRPAGRRSTHDAASRPAAVATDEGTAWDRLTAYVVELRGEVRAAQPEVDIGELADAAGEALAAPAALLEMLPRLGDSNSGLRLASLYELDRFGDALSLSPEQQRRVTAILSQVTAGVAALAPAGDPELDSLRNGVDGLADSAETALAEVLRPEQLALWRNSVARGPVAEESEPPPAP